MKIGMITTMKFPYTTGAPLKIFKEVEYLVKKGYELDIITTDLTSDKKEIFGMPITRTKNLLKIKNRLKKADIVHAHNLEGAIIANLCRLPYMFDVHGFMFLEYPHLIQKKGMLMKILRTKPVLSTSLKLIKRLFDRAINNAVCLNADADSMRDYLVENYNKKTFSCPCGYNEIFLGVKNFEPDTFIYTGNFYSWQNIGMTIDAFNNLKKGKYIIVGDGDQREYLKSIAKNKNINFAGRVEHNKVIEYLEKAGIGFSPRIDEETTMMKYFFPTKLIDYMASGKAVIGVNIGEQAEIIRNSGCGAALPNNVELWKETMQKFIDNPRKTKKMGKNGREYVKEKYSWNNTLKDLEKAYAYYQEKVQ